MTAERDDTRFETCRIVFWRGYVKCAFYAVPERGEPIGSPYFRSREQPPAASGRALDAHRALVERLEADGWQPVARGREWYALTFRRRTWTPFDELPLEEQSAVAAIEAFTGSPPPPERVRTPEPPPSHRVDESGRAIL